MGMMMSRHFKKTKKTLLVSKSAKNEPASAY